MANWCNARLIVFGTRSDIRQFDEAAMRRTSGVFLPDMWSGESGDLSWCGMRRRDNRYEKAYFFQIRNDDGGAHFADISTRWPALTFLCVYATSDFSEIGAFRIANGRRQQYVVGHRRWRSIYQAHGCVVDPPDEDEDDNDFNFHLASLDAMDAAEAHWRRRLPVTTTSDRAPKRVVKTRGPR